MAAFLRRQVARKLPADLSDKTLIVQRPVGVLETSHQLRKLHIIPPDQMIRPVRRRLAN